MPLDDNDLDAGASLFSDMHANTLAAEAAASDPPPAAAEPSETPPPGGAAPAPSEPSSAAPRSTVIRDAFRARGWDYGDDADDDAVFGEVEEVLGMGERIRQEHALVEHGRRYQQYAPQFEAWLQQQAAGGQPAQPAAKASPQSAAPSPGADEDPFASWNQPPECDPQLEALCEFDRSLGQFRYRDDVIEAARKKGVFLDPAGPQKLMAFKRWENDHAQRVIRDFPALTGQIVDQRLKSFDEQVRAAAREIYEEERTNEQIAEFVAANRQQLFQVDEKGRVKVDPRTGEHLRAPFGNLVNAYTKHFLDQFYGGAAIEQLPARERRKVVTHAFTNATRDWNVRQAAAAKPPTETPAAGAATNPSPQSPVPSPGEDQPRDTRGRFISNAIEDAKRHAKTGGSGAPSRAEPEEDDEEGLSFSAMHENTKRRQRLNGQAAHA